MEMTVDYASVLHSAQRASIGEIVQRFRAIFVNDDDKIITLTFIYEGDINDEELDLASCVETEMISDFWEYRKFNFQSFRIDSPDKIPNQYGHCFYLRRNDRFQLIPNPKTDLIIYLNYAPDELENLLKREECLLIKTWTHENANLQIVDFGKLIGLYREKDTGILIPTSRAVVRASNPTVNKNLPYFAPTFPSSYHQNENVSRPLLFLSPQSALIGEICYRTRAIMMEWNEQKIDLTLIYDGEIQVEDLESSNRIETKLLADFHGLREITVKNIRVDYPNPFPDNLGACIHLRNIDLKYL